MSTTKMTARETKIKIKLASRSFVSGYIIKEMVHALACSIELWMHFGSWQSTKKSRDAIGYRLEQLFTEKRNSVKTTQNTRAILGYRVKRTHNALVIFLINEQHVRSRVETIQNTRVVITCYVNTTPFTRVRDKITQKTLVIIKYFVN